jgi:hypothetical protein
MRRRLLFLAAILVLGVYVLPQTTARIAGSHSWEYNSSGGGIYNIRCTVCHRYILEENTATTLSLSLTTTHKNAGENANYIGNGKPINISKSGGLPLFEGAMINTCLLCHLMEQDSVGWSGSHTEHAMLPAG